MKRIVAALAAAAVITAGLLAAGTSTDHSANGLKQTYALGYANGLK